MYLTRKRKFSAVILAAGMSSRMKGVKKQIVTLAGKTVLARAMEAFDQCLYCDEIILVCQEQDIAAFSEIARQTGIQKFKHAVIGGETRQKSALNGLKAISQDADYIAIHDAARCLITPEQIGEVFLAAYKNKCASAACPAVDTVKLADEHGKTKTEGQPQRKDLWYMQTPQIFYTDLYRAAAYTASEEGFEGTDDCSLAEHAGFGCTLINCGRENIKITEQTDLAIAEAILLHREKGENR